MKFATFVFLFLNFGVFAQHSIESIAEFSTPVIDYEVVNGKLVSLTEKNREFFINYTSPSGAQLFQTIDVKKPLGLFTDCMGNVFVETLDSAFQLSIGSFVDVAYGLDQETFKDAVVSCQAYFDSILVRRLPDQSLILEPVDETQYAQTPVINHIAYNRFDVEEFERRKSTGDSLPNMDTPEEVAEVNNERPHKNFYSTPGGGYARSYIYDRPDYHRRGGIVLNTVPADQQLNCNDLTAMKYNDSLVILDKTLNLLLKLSINGEWDTLVKINGVDESTRYQYDRTAEKLYVMEENFEFFTLKELLADGTFSQAFQLESFPKKRDLRIDNGFVYFTVGSRLSAEIQRVKLD